jgi:hypothetical protein
MTMDQERRPLLDKLCSLATRRREASRLFAVTFALTPGETVSWRVRRDSRIAVNGARVWLTRTQDPWDYWLVPGIEINLQRGERVWLSPDGQSGAEITLTTHVPKPRRAMRNWWFLLPRVR